MQHRNFVIDELFQLLWKLPFSKRTLRAYHLPDEEQQQIQMITALLIQLIQSNPNLHEVIGKNFGSSSGFDLSVDTNYPTKCYEAGTEASCLFWTRVVQRFTTAKTQNQDISELKVTIENLVADLLTTLNLPEYPASALILEVIQGDLSFFFSQTILNRIKLVGFMCAASPKCWVKIKGYLSPLLCH